MKEAIASAFKMWSMDFCRKCTHKKGFFNLFFSRNLLINVHGGEHCSLHKEHLPLCQKVPALSSVFCEALHQVFIRNEVKCTNRQIFTDYFFIFQQDVVESKVHYDSSLCYMNYNNHRLRSGRTHLIYFLCKRASMISYQAKEVVAY